MLQPGRVGAAVLTGDVNRGDRRGHPARRRPRHGPRRDRHRESHKKNDQQTPAGAPENMPSHSLNGTRRTAPRGRVTSGLASAFALADQSHDSVTKRMMTTATKSRSTGSELRVNQRII